MMKTQSGSLKSYLKLRNQVRLFTVTLPKMFGGLRQASNSRKKAERFQISQHTGNVIDTANDTVTVVHRSCGESAIKHGLPKKHRSGEMKSWKLSWNISKIADWSFKISHMLWFSENLL